MIHTKITTATTKKKVGRSLGLYPLHSFSFYLAHPIPLAGVYKLVWFGPYTRLTLFSFSPACFGCQLSFIPSSVALVRQSSICTSIIMLRFIIHAFLSWTTSTYTYTRTRNRSRLGYRRFAPSSLLDDLSLARTVLSISFQCTVR